MKKDSGKIVIVNMQKAVFFKETEENKYYFFQEVKTKEEAESKHFLLLELIFDQEKKLQEILKIFKQQLPEEERRISLPSTPFLLKIKK